MLFKRFILMLLAGIALLTPIFTPHTTSAQATPPATANAVITWNTIARRAAIQVGGLSTAHAMASVAFVQAAVYDAVVAISGGYQPYHMHIVAAPGASLDAAVASAAHGVLIHYFPAQRAALDADYSNALAAIPDGAAKTAGITVGQAAATGMIAHRQGDGLGADIGFNMPAPAPGVWQLPSGQNPMTPWASKLRPLMLQRPDQFRPDAPTPLSSRAWASDYNETRSLGSLTSTTRSVEQTDIARFWTTNPVVQYNSAFADLALARNLNITQTARLFAMGTMVGADALITCWDAKYHYLFWRPQFAIPLGESDGNPETTGDPAWKPLVATPPHPEYPSGHSCLTGAEAEVFTTFLGTSQIEIDMTSSVPNLLQPKRHYSQVDDLLQEVADARVWGGIHFRNATFKGMVLGTKVARWSLNRYFLPSQAR